MTVALVKQIVDLLKTAADVAGIPYADMAAGVITILVDDLGASFVKNRVDEYAAADAAADLAEVAKFGAKK